MVCYYFAIDNEYELTTWLKDPGPSFSEIKIQKKNPFGNKKKHGSLLSMYTYIHIY